MIIIVSNETLDYNVRIIDFPFIFSYFPFLYFFHSQEAKSNLNAAIQLK